MHASARALLLILCLIPGLVCVSAASAQTAPSSTAPAPTATHPQTRPATTQAAGAAELAPVILPAPSSDDEVRERLELVESRIAELTREAPTASAPATQPDEAAARSPAQKLYDALSLYRAELLRWQNLRAQLALLRSDEAINALTEQLKAWKEKTERYTGQRAPDTYVPRSEMEEIDREYNRLDAELADLTGQQASSEQQLASLRERKADSEAAIAQTLDALKTHLAALPDRLNEAKATQEREELLRTKRELEWAHNLQLLRAATFADSRAALELQQQQDADRITALSGCVKALREYRNRVDKARLQNIAAYASEQLAQDGLPPWKQTYWQIIQQAAGGLEFFQELDNPIRNRFPKSYYDRLEARITRGTRYWEDFKDSLDRRPGSAILSAYRRLGDRLRQDRALLDQLRTDLDLTTDEQKAAVDRQAHLLEEIDRMRERFDEQTSELTGEELLEARKLQAQLTSEIRSRLEERIQTVTSELQAVRERLKKALALEETYIDLLSRVRSGMYWSHLLVSEHRLVEHGWKPALTEARGLVDRQTPTAQAWHAYRADAGRELREMTRGQWISIALGLCVVLLGGAVIRRRVPPWGGWADAEALGFIGLLSLSRRVLAQLAEMIRRRAMIVLWLAVVALSARFFLGPGSGVAALSYVVVGFMMGLVACLAWIRANFDVQRPHLRLIPCSDDKAGYHTRWLRRLVLTAAIVLPIPVFLDVAGLLPEVRALLKTIAMLLLLGTAFAYLIGWQMFLGGPTEADKNGFLRSLARAIHPLLPVGAVVLAALELFGYDALVTYVCRGALISLIALWVAALLWLTLKERTRAADEKLDKALKPTDSADLGPDPQPTHPLLIIGGQILRVSVVAAAGLIVLGAFGIGPVEIKWLLTRSLGEVDGRAIEVWRVLAAIGAVGGGLILSRGVRAFLQAKVFPHSNVSRGAQAATNTLLHYSLIGLGAYAALLLLNIRFGALAVLLGTLGLGLGLGLQPVFVNFISGLLILFERHIKVGDIVEVGEQVGEVTAVSMRSTKIRTFDNVELDIPNGEFVTHKVVNWTLPDQKMRARIEVGVSYDADENLVKQLLLEVANHSPLVLSNPPPAVWFMNFGASSLDFELVCWFPNPATRWEFMTTVRFEIRRAFSEHNIEIPFPQRTLSVAGGKPIPVQVVSDGEPSPEPPRPPVHKPQIVRGPE